MIMGADGAPNPAGIRDQKVPGNTIQGPSDLILVYIFLRNIVREECSSAGAVFRRILYHILLHVSVCFYFQFFKKPVSA